MRVSLRFFADVDFFLNEHCTALETVTVGSEFNGLGSLLGGDDAFSFAVRGFRELLSSNPSCPTPDRSGVVALGEGPLVGDLFDGGEGIFTVF